MIPDKIYIPKNLAPHLTEEWASHTHGSLDEYISKDALMEWIQEARIIPHENAITRDLTFQEVVNKLNSM